MKHVRHTTECFLAKVDGLHDDIDYSIAEYTSREGRVTLKCTKHNHVYTQRAMDHYKYRGCTLCKNEKQQIKFVDWVGVCINTYENLSYEHLSESNWSYNSKVVVKCLDHGDFETNSKDHMLGTSNCKKCSGTYRRTLDEFIKEFDRIHNNSYTYKLPDKCKLSSTIEITCNQHGMFTASVRNHLINKSGCPTCAQIHKGWSRSSFLKAGAGRDCMFYVLKCYNDNEVFYKLGITSRTVKQRYAASSAMPYNYEVINTIQSDALTIWNIEKIFMKQLESCKYTPNTFFNGSIKECYKF